MHCVCTHPRPMKGRDEGIILRTVCVYSMQLSFSPVCTVSSFNIISNNTQKIFMQKVLIYSYELVYPCDGPNALFLHVYVFLFLRSFIQLCVMYRQCYQHTGPDSSLSVNSWPLRLHHRHRHLF